MKKVAIIGAGFVGLALAYQLLKTGQFDVTLFDKKGVGGGASGIAIGLMHPYPGEQSRKSKMAEEGMQATLRLLKVAEERLGAPTFNADGLIRVAFDEEAAQNLSSYSDVELLGAGRFFIKSGVSVFSKRYLEGLYLACQDLGVKLLIEDIQELPQGFDLVLIAAGAGSLALSKELPLKKVKGQALVCKGKLPGKNIVGKGYVAKGEKEGEFFLGATYERGPLLDETPDVEAALKDLKGKFAQLLPGEAFPEVLECTAAFRVTHPKDYFPLMEKMDDKTWAITAFGSRGLLYHALFAELFISNALK